MAERELGVGWGSHFQNWIFTTKRLRYAVKWEGCVSQNLLADNKMVGEGCVSQTVLLDTEVVGEGQ